MTSTFRHKIKQNVIPEDAGTIIINAKILGDDVKTLTTSSDLIQVFIAEEEWCQSKEDLDYFFDEEINDDGYVFIVAMMRITNYVREITLSPSYSTGCALELWWDIVLSDLDDRSENSRHLRNLSTSSDDTEFEEAIQESFNETNNILSRPANKLIVNSLPRKIYHKMTSSNGDAQICTICLEGFNDGERVVTLPCGHEFKEECIVNWFQINHVCPLCRFKLRC
ncbi:unnamed protein product [Cochlearia groenlandica]